MLWKITVIPYVTWLSEKLKRIFHNHNIPVNFKPGNTLRQRLVHPKGKTSRHKLSDVVKCSEGCNDLYIGETKPPLHKHMSQRRRPNSSGPESALHLHLKDKRTFLRGQWGPDPLQETSLVWERSQGSHLYKIKDISHWIEVVDSDTNFHPFAMLF